MQYKWQWTGVWRLGTVAVDASDWVWNCHDIGEGVALLFQVGDVRTGSGGGVRRNGSGPSQGSFRREIRPTCGGLITTPRGGVCRRPAGLGNVYAII